MTAPDAPPPVLGPLLRWRGAREGVVAMDVTVAGARPPRLEAEAPLGQSQDGAFARIGTLAGTEFWSARLTAPADHRGPVRYRAGGCWHRAHLPGAGGLLRVAFASCNGAEDETAVAAAPGGRAHLWRGLAVRHAVRPFHLAALGGDQIYADGLWRLPSIRAWRAMPRRARYAAPFTPAMRAELEAHYLQAYLAGFADPAVADMLAQIPNVMIWDDHDIVDGWGSRPEAWQASPVAQGLFDVARRAFCLVQLGRDPDRHAPPYGWDAAIGCAHVVVPDLRSERRRDRVMGPEGHRRLSDALGGLDAPHALVIASVPLVNADLSPIERVVAPIQPLVDLYQDDLRDQWMSYRHRAEWAEVMGGLLDAAARGTAVSVLSGEIHLGARGVARRDGAEVAQFIASGIAHPAPPEALARLYETAARLTRRRAGIGIEMCPVTPDGRRYVAARNWLELTARPDGTSEVTLHVEGGAPLHLAGAPAAVRA